MLVSSIFISTIDGTGNRVPREISVGPKRYPFPKLTADVYLYKSVKSGGNMAHLRACSALFANVISRVLAGGKIVAPCDFIKDKNSFVFIFIPSRVMLQFVQPTDLIYLMLRYRRRHHSSYEPVNISFLLGLVTI